MKEGEEQGFQGKSVEVARVQEIPAGKIKHVEIEGKEIAVANIGGKYYAFDDRCGHSSARLSMGTVSGNVVTCPFHGAQFDCTTGRKVRDANTTAPPTDGLPDAWKKNVEYAYNILSYIKTYDQKTYGVTVEGDRIKVSILPAAVVSR
ncbi:Rieske (2Fe-2S) protein [Nitrososphaera viennensis]|uniref:Rieske 2Fe-2S domain-containing protein n=2 Tax=Nitrososphaera viennensis TaxID=1034015 RepID=A0A977NLG8_9ARCH|nr:Rieske 2Fe-2S domain-containing protein [Nitrososphaera viennensis]AIC16812.1 putative Naphthalene 1,2-dioxygenase system ferredoxin subunit [Nitrososphaera viennensis EN76]UVS68718.1 Rieske 2Fe-2S domain-containing protein [Nitrososphaera viennensis]